MTRWLGPFATPNLAGLILATLTMPLLAWAVGGCRRLPQIVGWLLVAACLAGVIVSQSRAAAVAVFCGCFVLWSGRAAGWRPVLLVAVALCLGWLLYPPAAERLVASRIDEASMGARWELWRSALAVAVQFPWGVGPDAMSVIERWYLPPASAGRFATVLNDTLNLVLAWGWAAAAALLALLGALISLPLLQPQAVGMGWRIASGALAVLAVGSQFQGHHVHMAALVAWGLCLATIIWSWWQRPPPARLVRHACFAGMACAIAVLLPALTTGWGFAQRHGILVERSAYGVCAKPAGRVPASPLLVICSDDEREATALAMLWGRAAIGAGQHVVVIKPGGPLPADAVVIARGACTPWLGAGAERVRRFVLVDAEIVPPTDLDVPIVVLAAERGPYTPRQELRRWAGPLREVRFLSPYQLQPEVVWPLLANMVQ